jgi:hypothetical protein
MKNCDKPQDYVDLSEAGRHPETIIDQDVLLLHIDKTDEEKLQTEYNNINGFVRNGLLSIIAVCVGLIIIWSLLPH